MAQPESIRINWKSLAEAVRIRRASKMIDQKVAAEEMQISASSLCRLERGKTVTADSFMAVCAWLGEEPTKFSTEVS